MCRDGSLRRCSTTTWGRGRPRPMAQQIPNFFKFKNFYEQMEFIIEQHLGITKVINVLSSSSGGLSLTERKPHGGNQFEDNTMVFYEWDRQVMSSQHKSLFMQQPTSTTLIWGAMVDPSSSLKSFFCLLSRGWKSLKTELLSSLLRCQDLEVTHHLLLVLLTSTWL